MNQRKWAGVFLLTAAIANCAFLLAPWVGATLSASASFVSELSSRGQPSAMFFRISDFVTGWLLLIALALSWRVIWPTKWLRVAHICVILFAVCLIIDTFAPLDCPPTSDLACRALEEAGNVTLAHKIHSVTGVIEGLSTATAMLALGFGTWSTPKWKWYSRVVTAAGVFFAILGLAIIVQYLERLDGIGIAQRLQMLMFSTALGAAALKIFLQEPVPFPEVRYAAVTKPFSQRAEQFPELPGIQIRVQLHGLERPGPRVIFSNGLGLPLDYWLGVVEALDRPCILFDRPGLGGSSEWVEPPLTVRGEIALLTEVVRRFGEDSVVLVGHSWGGVLAETAVRLEPDLAAALVFVDASDPDEERRRAKLEAQPWQPGRFVAFAIDAAAALIAGFMRSLIILFGTRGLTAMRLPDPARRVSQTAAHVRATLSELSREPNQAAEAVAIASESPLPTELPVTYLVGTVGGWPLHRPQTKWVEQMRRRCDAAGWELIEVEGAHLLMLDQPEIVADAVEQMVRRVEANANAEGEGVA